MNIQRYHTLIFDCDGVVLNSNKVKTEAFYQAALPYGKAAAQQLVDYHVARGGISRYEKFEWFVQHVVAGHKGPGLDQLLAAYAEEVRQGLLQCDIAEGLVSLRELTSHARWLIVSGGDQAELRYIFAVRELTDLFDGGIFGSPDNKHDILAREFAVGNIQNPALFLGDSKYDFEAAKKSSLDFAYISGWSEWSDAKCFEKEFTETSVGLNFN